MAGSAISTPTYQARTTNITNPSDNSSIATRLDTAGVNLGGSTLSRFVNWTSYTATLANHGNATQSMMYMVIGNCLWIRGTIKIGSSLPTGVIAVSIPGGYTMSFAKHVIGPIGTDAYQRLGGGYAYKADNSKKSDFHIVRNNASTSTFYFSGGDGSTYSTPTDIAASAGTFTFVAGDTINFDFMCEIA